MTISRMVPYVEIIAVYFTNRRKHSAKNTAFVCVKAGVVYVVATALNA
jgi:hypothetical protein